MLARLSLLSLSLSLVVVGSAGAAHAKKPAKPAPKYTAADCDTAIAKLRPVVEEIAAQAAKEAGQPATKPDMTEMLGECKANVAKGEDPGIECVLHAGDRAAVRVCVDEGVKAYQARLKRIEASMALSKLRRQLSLVMMETAGFPAGKARTLPDKPCCPQPDQQCAVTGAWAKDPVWTKLDFQIDEPSRFQYSYRSDGLTAHITAVGNPMCSGTPITFTLDAKIVDGAPVFTQADPPG
ncbi:MAG TPA: hypothetical protein VH165_15670 [Kofleriaceae bacterium]|jgi:hypothetical protein|nr:hypothetical protein [Kofleriaceae bacterium]